ncbi:DUF1016 N-terminal domain-containing protein [Methanoregula sp.]|uniref:DUF1016 N-terminal domain-containing protein n=1 Tax=Methanoregula sp. TaxID=2052170 RepID=UPI003C71C821
MIFRLPKKGYTVCSELSWSHYRLLMRMENPSAREYYIGESISQNRSVRALERQTPEKSRRADNAW